MQETCQRKWGGQNDLRGGCTTQLRKRTSQTNKLCKVATAETAEASSIQSVFHVQPKSSATQGLGFNPLKTHFQVADAPNNPLEVLVHNLYLDQVLLEIRMGTELHGLN